MAVGAAALGEARVVVTVALDPVLGVRGFGVGAQGLDQLGDRGDRGREEGDRVHERGQERGVGVDVQEAGQDRGPAQVDQFGESRTDAEVFGDG